MKAPKKNSELAWHMGMTSSAASRRLNPISTSVTSDSMALPWWLRMAPFGLPVVPEVYISVQGSSALTSIVRPRVARLGDQVLVAAVAGRALGAEDDEIAGRHRQIGAHALRRHPSSSSCTISACASQFSTM